MTIGRQINLVLHNSCSNQLTIFYGHVADFNLISHIQISTNMLPDQVLFLSRYLIEGVGNLNCGSLLCGT